MEKYFSEQFKNIQGLQGHMRPPCNGFDVIKNFVILFYLGNFSQTAHYLYISNFFLHNFCNIKNTKSFSLLVKDSVRLIT